VKDQAAHVYVGCLIHTPGRTSTRLPSQEDTAARRARRSIERRSARPSCTRRWLVR
jgi:hypothetical protein